MINASPTEKLIRELKAENNKLLSRLAGLTNSGKAVAAETSMYDRAKVAKETMHIR